LPDNLMTSSYDLERLRSSVSVAAVALLLLAVACSSGGPTHTGHHHDRSTSSTVVPSTSAPSPTQSTVATPDSIRPVVHPPVTGEGTWRSAAPWVPDGSPVQVTWYRPDPGNPSIRATVMWIDPTRSQVALYPGRQNPPPSPLPQGPAMVPPSARRNLLATFNSGFYLATPNGSQPGAVREGFAVNGNVYSPFVKGLATLVVTADGGVDIAPWTGGSKPPPADVVARQNLPLLVNHGVPTAAADRPA